MEGGGSGVSGVCFREGAVRCYLIRCGGRAREVEGECEEEEGEFR